MNDKSGYDGPIELGSRFNWGNGKDSARCYITVKKIINTSETIIFSRGDSDKENSWNNESWFRENVTPLEQWKLNPEDRDDGYECLALHRGKWQHVKWSVGSNGWSLGYAQPFMADIERPFFEIPENVKTDFYGWAE